MRLDEIQDIKRINLAKAASEIIGYGKTHRNDDGMIVYKILMFDSQPTLIADDKVDKWTKQKIFDLIDAGFPIRDHKIIITSRHVRGSQRIPGYEVHFIFDA